MKENFKRKILRPFKYAYLYTLAPISILFQRFFRTIDEQNYYSSRALVVSQVNNEAFSKYKNIYNGKDIVIIASGPSLNKYIPIKNTINIAVNRSFLYEKVNVDYIFMMDYVAVKDYIEMANKPPYKNIPKFYGLFNKYVYGFKELRMPRIPESLAIRHNATRFYAYLNRSGIANYEREIDRNWVAGNGGIASVAAQFALFTNPKRLYLVGCDCSSGYFNSKNGNNARYMIAYWKQFKDFANEFYPDTEIISVNPVGLKGLFKDLYQDVE